jgi:hypothetical protein
MLHHKSKIDDVNHYIAQMEMLLLSDRELQQINQIMALENLVKDQAIKGLIAEDLKDDAWIEDTKILINTCYKKIEKSMIVQNHIDDCKNFIVYRFLEDRCRLCDMEIYKQISGWNFNEIDKHGNKSRWVSAKFMRSFTTSLIPSRFDELMGETTSLSINLAWLHLNRTVFYTEELFMDLNQRLKNTVEA